MVKSAVEAATPREAHETAAEAPQPSSARDGRVGVSGFRLLERRRLRRLRDWRRETLANLSI